LAEGPFESIVEATRAARACGLAELRVEVGPEISRMFYAGAAEPGRGRGSLVCLAQWQRKHARRLSLNADIFAYNYGPRPRAE